MRLRPALAFFSFAFAGFAAAQDIKLNVTYVCSGEHIYVESCNIRDTSDTSTCMVAHPDHLTRTGMNSYTTMTRAALKKLLPTCTQPSAAQIAAEANFEKKQQALIDAQTPKYNSAPPAAATAQQGGVSFGALPPPKNAQEREMRRCVTSGRLLASCTGNGLLDMFTGMISSTVSSLTGVKPENTGPDAGPTISGVYQGAGKWRLDFITDGVLVNCSFLAPNEEAYSLSLANNRATLTIHTTPKPLVLRVNMDGTITGPPGPVTIDGVVASGYDTGLHDGFGNQLTASQAANSTQQVYDSNGHPVTSSPYAVAGHATFSSRRTTCPAINLTSKGTGIGVETMETNVLKSAFGGDTGPPTPIGIRMHGIYAAPSTGFSVEFFPESAILGCGPDAARAYPYTVVADGTKSVVTIAAPDHPLTLAFRSDGSLDPGSGSYQVHGRVITGQDANDDYTFAPMERNCNLAVITPAKEIPAAGGASATAVASAGASLGLSTPDHPLGNATLAVLSGLPGSPNALSGRPLVLLRDSYANALAKGGVDVPAGDSPYVYVGKICAPQPRTAACQNALTAINTNAASAVRADAKGNGTMPGVPPGTYYLMISAPLNGQPVVWGQAVTLHAGENSITLTAANSQPLR
ncbi:MAG TPA: carboxypeptidase-like regulatory domain-containing protein [Terracidiphilus sp.]|nr:carboxypeptidase-like regulatory domain-containing protein [Terracidiphilus sp.]